MDFLGWEQREKRRNRKLIYPPPPQDVTVTRGDGRQRVSAPSRPTAGSGSHAFRGRLTDIRNTKRHALARGTGSRGLAIGARIGRSWAPCARRIVLPSRHAVRGLRMAGWNTACSYPAGKADCLPWSYSPRAVPVPGLSGLCRRENSVRPRSAGRAQRNLPLMAIHVALRKRAIHVSAVGWR